MAESGDKVLLQGLSEERVKTECSKEVMVCGGEDGTVCDWSEWSRCTNLNSWDVR